MENVKTQYSEEFDKGNSNWSSNYEINQLFLTAQLNYCCHLLQVRGYLFLNDVYDMLGIDRISNGQLVGWLNTRDKSTSMFEVGTDPNKTITIVFNTDGIIYDKLRHI